MYKTPYLKTICDQNARLEVFVNTPNLSNETLAKVNHSLALCSHLLDELLYLKPDTTGYIDHILADLVKRVDSLPAIVQHRGITAEICKCPQGYACTVRDAHNNDLRWYVNANSMPQAVAVSERYFDAAIACLRGFTTTGEFYGRMHGYCV